MDKYVYSDDLPFDARVLNMICFIGLITVFISIIGHTIALANWMVAVNKLAMLVGIGFVLYLTNKHKAYKLVKWITVLCFCDVLFPMLFLVNGGTDGGTPVYFILGLMLIVLLLDGIPRAIMLLSNVLIITTLYAVDFLFPWWIVNVNDYQHYVDNIVACLTTAFFLGFVIVFLNKMYVKERERADFASRAKGDFLAQMSHEMRSPMNAIIGMSAIAKTASDDEKRRISITKIEEAAQHLLGVINDVLDMSKIEAGKLVLDSSDFDSRRTLERVLDVNVFLAGQKDQALHVDIDPTIPRYLKGDSQRLSQVIANLLSNAIKFTPQSGTIWFTAALVSEEHGRCLLRFTVKDTGIGIEPAMMSRLFKPFEQADNSASRGYSGTGLGLVISKQIIEAMDGQISVQSTPGQGSTFTFDIRVAEARSSVNIKDPVASNDFDPDNAEDFSKYTIMLVEDVVINQEIVSALLEPTGISISIAENGEEAVAQFRAAPDRFDLIFMDVQMPIMDGYEATREIRRYERQLDDSTRANVPIYAMTANVFKEDIQHARQVGMNGHIGKPLNISELYKLLRDTLTTP
jgi:signal transduction histidine kinase/CheY-like chemotaxis protein